MTVDDSKYNIVVGVLRRIYDLVKNNVTGEWRRKNTELVTLYNELNTLEIIRRWKTFCVWHVCRNQNPQIRAVTVQNPY